MEYIEYTYYDEVGNYIAIIKENTPIEEIEKMKGKFDKVQYKE